MARGAVVQIELPQIFFEAQASPTARPHPARPQRRMGRLPLRRGAAEVLPRRRDLGGYAGGVQRAGGAAEVAVRRTRDEAYCYSPRILSPVDIKKGRIR